MSAHGNHHCHRPNAVKCPVTQATTGSEARASGSNMEPCARAGLRNWQAHLEGSALPGGADEGLGTLPEVPLLIPGVLIRKVLLHLVLLRAHHMFVLGPDPA